MSSLEGVLRGLFDNYEVVRENEATLPLIDFEPLVTAPQLEVLCSAMNTAVPNWEGVTALIGMAERSSGPLTHLLAHRRGLPYSLVNWYPEGSRGDIVVGPALSFTGEAGNTFLNGLTRDKDLVVYVDDCIRKGSNSLNVLKAARAGGIRIACVVTVARFEGSEGVQAISAEFGVPVISLCSVDARSGMTKVTSVLETPLYAPTPLPDMKTIKSWHPEQIKSKFQEALDAFVGNEIYHATGSTYPYCNFTLTDCQPLLRPELVESMAECMIYLGHFDQADVIVSEADRGGGPLVLAIARRTGLPFSLANWKPPAKKSVGVAASAQVGYSGSGSLYLNGIHKGAKVVVIDDMLSSGGTAEGLFHAIEQAGGVLLEAHFASEKVTTKGRDRLAKTWPNLPLYSICYFEASGKCTKETPPGPRANETPLQKHLPGTPIVTGSPADSSAQKPKPTAAPAPAPANGPLGSLLSKVHIIAAIAILVTYSVGLKK